MDELTEPDAEGAGPGERRRRKKSLRRRARHRVTLALTGRGGRWAAVILACVAVLLVGLLAEGFLSSPGPTPRVPPAAQRAIASAFAGPAVATVSTAGSGGGATGGSAGQDLSGPASTGEVSGTLHSVLPDNPLNHLSGANVHRVTVEVSSAGPIGEVGYFVPTGTRHTYGTAHPDARHWQITQQALGGGYLAAVFVQSGASGTPITCRVLVDGRPTSHSTTSGAYGRAVCLG